MQPVYGRSTQPGHSSSRSATEQRVQATDSRLGAALDFSWSLEFAKDSASRGELWQRGGVFVCRYIHCMYSTCSGSPTSPSTGSSSRTPSPFGAASAFAMTESYSRKVFVGGLPPDIDEGK